MLLTLKKGISTAIGIATMSIVSAGILGSGHYSSVSTDERVEVEASQLATYLNAVQARINEGYTLSKTFNIENDKNPKSGSFWSIDGVVEVAKIFMDESDTPKGLTFTQARVLFANKYDRCISWPQSTPNTQFGYWQSKKHNNLISCNMYRVYGPLHTTISSDTLLKTSPVIIIKRGIEEEVKITTDPDSTPNEEAKKRQIDKAMIAIPLLNTTSQADKKIIIQLARTLKAKLQSNASVFYTYHENTGANKITQIHTPTAADSENHGLSSSLILGSKCADAPDKSCFLNIHLKPLSGIGSGCDDCLKQDGSNSMHEPITFLDEDGSDYPAGKPLIVWRSDGPVDQQKPTNTEVVAGFVLASGCSDITKNTKLSCLAVPGATWDDNQFELKMDKKSVFTVDEFGNAIDIKSGAGTDGLKIDTQSGTNLVELYNANNSKVTLNKNIITVSSIDNVDIDSKNISLKVSDKIIHTVDGNKVLSSESDASGSGVRFPENVKFEKDIYLSPGARLLSPGDSSTIKTWVPYPGDNQPQSEYNEWGQQIPNMAKIAEVISLTSKPLHEKLKALQGELNSIRYP